jgi:hypothetical protein
VDRRFFFSQVKLHIHSGGELKHCGGCCQYRPCSRVLSHQEKTRPLAPTHGPWLAASELMYTCRSTAALSEFFPGSANVGRVDVRSNDRQRFTNPMIPSRHEYWQPLCCHCTRPVNRSLFRQYTVSSSTTSIISTANANPKLRNKSGPWTLQLP